MHMSKFPLIIALAFLIPLVSSANDYYWKIGQCASDVQSEACDGKIVFLSLTDTTHYGENKLINLPPSVGTAMTYETCNTAVNKLVSDLRYYDQAHPFVTYITSPWMILAKNEERFAVVLKHEPNINSCIEKHLKNMERAEIEAQKQTQAEAEAIKQDELDKQKQLADEQAKREAEEAQKRQEEIDMAVAQALAEQAVPKTPVAPIAPSPAPTSARTPEPAIADNEPTEVETVPERVESQEEDNTPEPEPDLPQITEPEPINKPSIFRRIRNFFTRWF